MTKAFQTMPWHLWTQQSWGQEEIFPQVTLMRIPRLFGRRGKAAGFGVSALRAVTQAFLGMAP